MHYFVDKDDNDKEYQIQKCPFCGTDVAEVMSQAELWEDNCFSIDVVLNFVLNKLTKGEFSI